MKNKWLMVPVVVLAVFGLALAGCSTGGDDGGGDDWQWGQELAPLTITLADNFEYGDGYQGQYADGKLFNAPNNKVNEGDVYWLDVTFTASRDLESPIYCGIVDVETNYWNPLTWDGAEDSDDEGACLAPDEDPTYIVKAGEEISVRVRMVGLKTSANGTTRYNTLNIQSVGEGTPKEPGSGVKKQVDLVFTHFTFTKE